MIIITIQYAIKWRLFGVTLGQQSSRLHYQFAVPIADIPPGILFDEPMTEVGRGFRLGLRVELT